LVYAAPARPGAAPHTLVGLNVTTRCTMTAADFRVRHRAAVPPAPALLEMAEAFFRHRRHVTFNDPLAAAVALSPELCSYEAGVVTMNLNAGGEAAARSFFAPDRAAAERSRTDVSSGHRVAKGVRVDRFFTEYFDALCGTLPPGGFAPVARGL
jgi:inosine-uridine nucleoside N-ribohydrolase